MRFCNCDKPRLLLALPSCFTNSEVEDVATRCTSCGKLHEHVTTLVKDAYARGLREGQRFGVANLRDDLCRLLGARR